MRIYSIILLVANMICSLPAIAHAERQPEDRKRADIVVSGEVNRVYVRDTREYYHYIVELRVDEVEAGKNIEPKGTLYVYCFDRKPDAPIEPAMSGHDAPPKEGERIKAYLKSGKGKHEAIYPQWFDRLRAADSK
jgi:hypothetical protein